MTQAAPEAIFALGAAALEAQDLRGAERLFRGLVESDPRTHPAWNALSVVAVRSGDPRAAREYAQRALELDRRNPLYLNNLGVACGELGEYAEAEAAFRRALKLRPVYAEGMFNLGKVLHKQGRLADAARAFERAHAMQGDFPGLKLSLALLYRLNARAADALALLAPHANRDPAIARMYAGALAEAEGPRSAIGWMEAACAAAPQWRDLRFLLGVTRLSMGEWREGWGGYFWRPTVPRREALLQPLPADLAGKRILLKEEQGIGDVLFFLRFAPQLRARGARLALQCPPKLWPLLEGDALVERDSSACDYEAWIGDLPALLEDPGTPPPLPLRCAEEARRSAVARLAALGAPPYLALTWRAGTDALRRQEFGNPQDLLSKEVPPAALGAAARGWRGTLLSLQRHPYPGELAAVATAAGAPVHDLAALNEDLPALLAILDVVDEYATVSNTNVHLRAGLGKPSRVLVPQPAEWRWMHEGDSPWFPGCHLYRQPQSRDWSPPLGTLSEDLLGK